MKKTVVLGVTSGIAAFKSVELVKLLVKQDMEVFVIMTKSATQMIPPKEFEEATGNTVYTELFDKEFDYKDILKIRHVDHIDLADKADVFVIAPATANIIAKIAYGIADDFLTTTLLAVHCPVIICPSMNVNMWNNPATQDNISILKKRGYIIIDPEKGMLACGYEGQGRLAHIKTIKDEVILHMQYSNSLKGKKIIVTAGGTSEKIDDVRYITNRSSGKMGIAIAEESYLRGGEVLLLRSKSSVVPRYLIPEKTFETTDELYKLLEQNIKKFDVAFHAAAISDFLVSNSQKGKLSSNEAVKLKLSPRKKIIDSLKKLNPSLFLIAFKAEWNFSEEKLINAAQKKLRESNSDVIVANDISRTDRGFQVDTNEVVVVCKGGNVKKILLAKKSNIAKGIIDFLFEKKAF
ncbi:MAG: bifunctional phosphopantothenoylcysteine decarboxylase/phosphopantothenate--cysteine ligase CoaBC [bacterium]|nr:bifunctional phosphopantothenoylcysteine decarboxylase/phosphopantothenate--cysteine ligase CoaBC [bacterium]